MIKNWILASRPATLTAAIVPVMVGTACAYALGGMRLLPALAALFGAIWIQIGTNFANDVFDAEKGADTEERLGPTRAVASGLISGTAMKRAMYLAFGLAALSGVYLAWASGWPVIAIGIFSVLSGIAYTGGPYPLGYNGLGDIFVMIFFGFVAVCGTVYVQMLDVPTLAWLVSVPVGAIATAILVVNNVRDADTDIHAGKRTLVARFGKSFGLVEYALLLAAAYGAVLLLLIAPETFGLELASLSLRLALPLVSAPLAVLLTFALIRKKGKALNPVLARTAMLLLVFGLLLSVSLFLVGMSR